MQTRMYVAEPDKVPVTLTITMTVGDWKALKKQLISTWPSSTLSRAIFDGVGQVEKHFWPKTEPPENNGEG